MNTNVISGYTGLIRPPIMTPSRYGPSAYFLTTPTKNEVLVILLSSGVFADIYKILSSSSYSRITITIPSLNMYYMSDLFNLVTRLQLQEKSVRWVFPNVLDYPSSSSFLDAQIKTTKYNLVDIERQNILMPSIEFIPTREYDDQFKGSMPDAVYDILIRDTIKNRLICQYLDEDKLLLVGTNYMYNEIHLPYSFTRYGGMTYVDAITSAANISKDVSSKLYANEFASEEEYAFCFIEGSVQLPKYVYTNITDVNI